MDSIFTIALPTLFLLYKCVLHLACGNLHMVSHVCRPQAAILSWSPIDHLCWRNILQPICLRSTYSGLYKEQRIFIKSPELVSKGLMLIIDSSIIHWFFCQSWGLKVLLSPGPELIAFLHLNLSRLYFPGGSDEKESVCSVEEPYSLLGWGRSPGEGNGYPIQYSCLENPMDEEPGRLQFLGSQKVGRLRTHTGFLWNCLKLLSFSLRPYFVYKFSFGDLVQSWGQTVSTEAFWKCLWSNNSGIDCFKWNCVVSDLDLILWRCILWKMAENAFNLSLLGPSCFLFCFELSGTQVYNLFELSCLCWKLFHLLENGAFL